MNKDEIILMLQQLVASLQQQLADSNRKVDVLLQEVAELKELLVRKTQEEQKQRNIVKGLSKIMQNKSEKQTPAKPESASGDGCTQDTPEAKPREKTNYGARRIDHCVTEMEHVPVDPDDPRFDKERARWISELLLEAGHQLL